MKTRILFFVLSLLFFNSCNEISISKREKKKALHEYATCTKIADQWLFKLDSSDYHHLKTLKFAAGANKDTLLGFINEVQKVYGKIKCRSFIGAHIWSGKKLLTYEPYVDDQILARTHMKRSEDGFYIVNPKYFGFSSADQMFAKFPKGRYVVLMYRSVPTYESYAEEAVILQYNPAGSWEVFTYEISDDI